eukprot:1136240-Pelagomonas_calceolata.AAC.11
MHFGMAFMEQLQTSLIKKDTTYVTGQHTSVRAYGKRALCTLPQAHGHPVVDDGEAVTPQCTSDAVHNNNTLQKC